MKIGPFAARQIAPPARDGTARGESGLGGERAFGFDELGMFGLAPKGASPDPAPGGEPAMRGAAHKGAEGDRAPPPPAGPDGAASAEPVQSAEGAPVARAPGKPLAASPLAGSRVGDPVGAMEALAPGEALRGPPPKGPPGECSEAPRAARARPVPPPAREAAVRVLVAEQDGRLRIAIGSTPLDGEGRTLLRRLIREILAGRGLSLDELRLNGAPLDADFQISPGGKRHGARSN